MPLTRISLLSAIVICFMLAGCAQNTVRLSYAPPAEQFIPNANAATVCVVAFEDRRDKIEIGQRRDTTSFQPQSSVTDWVSRALADELARCGMSVSYAYTLEQAKAANQNYIVTGVLEEVWLTENSFTSLSSSMRATITLLRGNGTAIHKNSFASTVTRTVMPTASSPQKVLEEGLKELVLPAAKKIEQSAR